MVYGMFSGYNNPRCEGEGGEEKRINNIHQGKGKRCVTKGKALAVQRSYLNL